jgi:hypothetical protein
MRRACFASALAVFSFVLLSCASAGITGPAAHGGEADSPVPMQNNAGAHSIREILENPARFAGKEVVLRGEFRGWKADCPSSTMVTRSDWVLEDGTDCLYVTGRIPSGLLPSEPQGETLLIRGRVVTSRAGKAVLSADRIIELPH